MSHCILLAAMFLAGPNSVFVQDRPSDVVLHLKEGEAPGKGTLADVAWLSGRWLGEGLDGTCDETWNPPLGGSMVGCFRYIKHDQLVFSEFFMLSEEQGSLTLRLKHFDPSFKGWEDKDQYVTFRLVRIEPDAAWFDGITYKRNGDKRLDVDVAIKNSRTGTTRVERFSFQRAQD